ncbi:MAG: hypothetical protein ACRER2_16445 [Methylococcales bacterium]
MLDLVGHEPARINSTLSDYGKLVMLAGKRVSSAMDGKLKSIHGAWIRFALLRVRQSVPE